MSIYNHANDTICLFIYYNTLLLDNKSYLAIHRTTLDNRFCLFEDHCMQHSSETLYNITGHQYIHMFFQMSLGILKYKYKIARSSQMLVKTFELAYQSICWDSIRAYHSKWNTANLHLLLATLTTWLMLAHYDFTLNSRSWHWIPYVNMFKVEAYLAVV